MFPPSAPFLFRFGVWIPSNSDEPMTELELWRTDPARAPPPQVTQLLSQHVTRTLIQGVQLIIYHCTVDSGLVVNSRATHLARGRVIRGNAIVFREYVYLCLQSTSFPTHMCVRVWRDTLGTTCNDQSHTIISMHLSVFLGIVDARCTICYGRST